jgi:hypothetical protein
MRKFIVNLKNNNLFLLFFWSLSQKKKGEKSLKRFSDKEAITQLYQNYSGRKPNLENPTTFSEKIQWLKLNYHNPLQTTCADKFEVRKYICEKGYPEILSKVLQVCDHIDQLKIDELPEKFVIKATHGSGWNLICTDKKKINWFWWKKIMKVWLDNNIFWPGREWPYKNMKPRLIVEEFLMDKSGMLMDYKLFCFNGKVKFVQVNINRGTKSHTQNFYDLNWNILPFGKNLNPRPEVKIEAPNNFQKMIQIAEDLTVDLPFVRADFYEVNNEIIFGEMTFCPKSGLPDFTPPEYDGIVGEFLELPKIVE